MWTPDVSASLKAKHRDRIIGEACKRYSVSTETLTGHSRNARAVAARQEIMGRLTNELGLSRGRIAQILQRDKATVRCGIRSYEEAL